MFTSLTETNPASEYQNPPSRSSVFNGYSINYGEYLVSRILAGFEVILRKSNSESIEQITSAYADRDTDTLNKGDKCDRRFANQESDAIANHTIAIAFATRRNLVFLSFQRAIPRLFVHQTRFLTTTASKALTSTPAQQFSSRF